MEVVEVQQVIAPYRVARGIDWTALLKDIETVIAIVLMDIRLKQKLDEDADEEEALIWMLA